MPVTIDYTRHRDPKIEAAIHEGGYDAVTEGYRWLANWVQEAKPATYEATRRMTERASVEDDAEEPWLEWERRKCVYVAFHNRFRHVITSPTTLLAAS